MEYRLPLKDRMERQILRRRERDQVREEMWSNTSKYFATWETRVTKFNEWTSNKYYDESLQCYEDKLQDENRKRLVELRREKLRALLKKENEQYQKELDAIEKEYSLVTKQRGKIRVDSARQIEYLRLHSAELQKRKEEERKKEVAVKDFMRWKANNPVIRDIESRHHAQFVRKAWEDQVKEKVERDRIAKEENNKIDHELALYQEQECQKLAEMEKEKKNEIEHWKTEIYKQTQELKLRDEMTKKLMLQMDAIDKQQRLLKETVDARERIRRDREQHKLLAKFWGKQTRLKIRALCNERIASITDEFKMLEYLKHLDEKRVEDRRNANVSAVSEKINAASQCLEQHRKLEVEREKNSAALFEEEARAFLRQQEIVWDNERRMREQLMVEVIDCLKQQIEEKRLNNQNNQEVLDKEKREILMKIEEKDREIAEVEAKTREKAEELKLQLTRQIYEKRKHKEREMLESLDMLSRMKIEEDQEKLYLRSEEDRLKVDGYHPKFYGFKKFAW